MYINNNHAIINNNYGRLQDLILFFKIPMDTRRNFFEMYRKFGHALSKRFANHAVCLCLHPSRSSSFNERPRVTHTLIKPKAKLFLYTQRRWSHWHCLYCHVTRAAVSSRCVSSSKLHYHLGRTGRKWQLVVMVGVTAVGGGACRGKGKVQDNRVSWGLLCPPTMIIRRR